MCCFHCCFIHAQFCLRVPMINPEEFELTLSSDDDRAISTSKIDITSGRLLLPMELLPRCIGGQGSSQREMDTWLR